MDKRRELDDVSDNDQREKMQYKMDDEEERSYIMLGRIIMALIATLVIMLVVYMVRIFP